MKKKLVVKNAIMSVIQGLFTGVTLFFLYKYFISTLGIERVGVWSLVLATTSLTNVVNLGLAGSIVKYVAKYNARDDHKKVADVIQTATVSLGVIIGLFLLILYPFAKVVLAYIIPAVNIHEAYILLPYSLFSFWINGIGGIYLSGIDGFQSTYLRSILLMVGSLVYMLLCFSFVPRFQMVGLGYAQIAQAIFVCVGGYAILKKFLFKYSIAPVGWNKVIFKEMIGYGINFQINTISNMVCDPVTKALLSKFGGLSMVGIYEMASRMIVQFRAIIVNANRVIVPTIAYAYEKKHDLIRIIYHESYSLIWYIAVPFFTGIVSFSPYISEVWIGHYEPSFIMFTWLLSFGWFMNLIIGPSYFTNLGTGDLSNNTIGHLLIAIMNGGLGYIFGKVFGGNAVVISWVIALSVGSMYTLISYHVKNKIPLRCMFPINAMTLVAASLLSIIIITCIYFYFPKSNILVKGILSMAVFFGIFVFPLWRHPLKNRISLLIASIIMKK